MIYLNTSENSFTTFAECCWYFSIASFTKPYLMFITYNSMCTSWISSVMRLYNSSVPGSILLLYIVTAVAPQDRIPCYFNVSKKFLWQFGLSQSKNWWLWLIISAIYCTIALSAVCYNVLGQNNTCLPLFTRYSTSIKKTIYSLPDLHDFLYW